MSVNNLDFGEHIDFSVKKKFGIITLDRTRRSNAFTQEQLEHLKGAIEHCQQDTKIRGLLLTNNGSSFSTGMDLDAIDGSDTVAVKKLEGTAADICKLLFNGKPAICAINGRTMGEGVVFSICCDYRIAVKDSFFQMPEIFSGIFPGTGCVILFSKIIGIPWTKKMLMFGEKISANKALEIGLVDQIVDSKYQLIEESLKKAHFLFSKNQTVLQAIKLCSNHFLDKSYTVAYEIEKIASGWYEHEDKENFIKEFKKEFE
jgi:enoyl-CoA hydratase/carnithine racemase